MKRFALEVVRPSMVICARRSRKLIDEDIESGVGNDGTGGSDKVNT